MKRSICLVASFFLTTLAIFSLPAITLAAGVSASGGGTYLTGQSFTVVVSANGPTFGAVTGKISVSGPVDIISFAKNDGITWVDKPSNNATFAGAVLPAATSATIATIVLRGNAPGTGSVMISGAELVYNGSVVATGSSSTNFQINRAPVMPGSVSVSSSTHPDPGQAYTNTTVTLSWSKASGVSGFGYIWDTSPNTAAPQSITTTDTSVTFSDQSVATHYFHIRAQNGDGWGPTSTFKVIIKEPDPQINSDLSKPRIGFVRKAKGFSTNLDTGTLSQITISGNGPAGYTANISGLPQATSTAIDDKGVWSVTLDSISAGFYILTVQGQKDKILTPVSDPFHVDLSVADGGQINTITLADVVPSPLPASAITPTPKPDTTKRSVSLPNAFTIEVFILGILLASLFHMVHFRKLTEAAALVKK